jgi:pimeloyl-ACP methyl ester carboxylesterase
MGGFWALRVAAASAIPAACLVFAPAFDIARDLDKAVPGIQDYIAHVIGARTLPELYELAKPFHLRDVLANIRCPVCIIHGTQDHICSFSASYEIASRVQSPLTVIPLVDLDHEVANPSTINIAGPGIEWLNARMKAEG